MKLNAPELFAVVVALDVPLNVTVAPLPPVPLIEPETVYVGTVMPVPVRVTAGVVGALLLIFIAPVTAPETVGANSTLRFADWFGARVVPDAMPVELKPAPEIATAEIVRFAVPLFVS